MQVPLVLLELHDTRRLDGAAASQPPRGRHGAPQEAAVQGGGDEDEQEAEEEEGDGDGSDGEEEAADSEEDEEQGSEVEVEGGRDAEAEQEDAVAFALGGGGQGLPADVVALGAPAAAAAASPLPARHISTSADAAAAGDAVGTPAACVAATVTVAAAAGAGAPEEEEPPEAAALLTSLLDCRAWRTPAQQVAALLLGCSRNLVIAGGGCSRGAGGDASGLVRALVQVGSVVSAAAAAAPRRAPGPRPAAARISGAGRPALGVGLGAVAVLPPRVGVAAARVACPVPRCVATQRLVLRRQAGLDAGVVAALLRELGGVGLQVLGVAGCGGVDVRRAVGVRQAAGAMGVSMAWSLE